MYVQDIKSYIFAVLEVMGIKQRRFCSPLVGDSFDIQCLYYVKLH